MVFKSELEIYCPVCGLMREPKYYRDMSMVPGANPIAKKILNTDILLLNVNNVRQI